MIQYILFLTIFFSTNSKKYMLILFDLCDKLEQKKTWITEKVLPRKWCSTKFSMFNTFRSDQIHTVKCERQKNPVLLYLSVLAKVFPPIRFGFHQNFPICKSNVRDYWKHGNTFNPRSICDGDVLIQITPILELMLIIIFLYRISNLASGVTNRI